MSKNIYQEQGYKDREEYLRVLADNYGIDFETVWALAEVNGENEDFDGLISLLEDYFS